MTKPVVVIGGGIVGASIALHLTDAGVDTVVVERDASPQGASSASFASLTALDETSRDSYLLKTLGIVGWHRWGKRLGREIGLRWGGEVRWAQSRDGAAELVDKVERAHARGYPVRLISTKQLKELVTVADPEPVEAASFAPEDGQVEPAKVIAAAKEALREAGSRFIHGRGKVVVNDGGVDVVVADERVEASTVVLAAGAESAALADRLGWEVPMVPSPGLLVTTSPAAPIAAQTIYVTPASGPPVHLRQLDDGRVLIGERGQDWVAQNPTRRHASTLLHQAARFFPALADVEIDSFSVEWRPMPGDRAPIIGPAPGLPSLYIAVMHSGVTLAPAVGELVAHELVEGRPAARLEPFRPARFAMSHARVMLDLEEVFHLPSEVYLG